MRALLAARSQILPIAAVGLGVALWPSLGISASFGPFHPFVGSWHGSGRVTTTQGQSEPINCRATYTGDDGDQALTQSLVCASDSYRFDVHSNVVANGGALQGRWEETTRGVQGDLSGEIASGDYEGSVAGPGFTAQISIRSNGHKQAVTIRPSAGDISSVEVSLVRQR